jgi:hypothetical protein
VDVGLHDLPASIRDAVSVVLRLGDAEFELVRQGTDDNFRLRLVLGDGADEGDGEDDDDNAGTSRAVLVLNGIDTANPEIEIELRRNSVTGLRFTQPGGSASAVRAVGQGAFGMPFVSKGILGVQGEENIIHVLGDIGGPLEHLACSRATVIAEARYNVVAPQRLALTLPGDGFLVEAVEVSGATVDAPPGGWSGASSYDVALGSPDGDDDDDACAEDRLVTSSATVLVKAIISPTVCTRSSAPVQMEVSGGDLLAPVAGEWTIVQRDIVYGARGGDVAKLQVYLTQILCGRFGCLRGSMGPVASVDGDYGLGTSLALWRFLLYWRGWSGPDQKVPTTAGEVELDGVTRTDDEIEVEAKALHDAHQGPTVTQALLDLVVSYYCLPYIGISIGAEIDPPILRVEIPEVTARWAKWSTASRTRVLPLADAIELHVTFELTCDAPGDLASVSAAVELEDGAAYRLVTSTKTLADLVSHGVTLVPSGQLAPGTKPRLVVRTDEGAELVAIALGGATDVRVGATAVGLDAAMIQKWLVLYPDKRGKGYLASADGAFGDGSRKALESFRKDEFKNRDDPSYVDILEQLRLAETQECAMTAEGGR